MSDDDGSGRPALPKKLLLFVALVVTAVVIYSLFGDYLQLEYLARRETQLKQLQQQSPWLVYGLAFFVYVIVTGLSLPGAAVLTLLMGWFFGLAQGIVLVSFASTTGATIAFLLSRFFFRESNPHLPE